MATLEQLARAAWVAWGDYAQHTVCGGCDRFVYCRRARKGRWICLGCFDQGER